MLNGQRVGGPEVKGLGSGGRNLDGRTVGPGWRSGGRTAGVRDKGSGARFACEGPGWTCRIAGPLGAWEGRGPGKSTRGLYPSGFGLGAAALRRLSLIATWLGKHLHVVSTWGSG
jgi:hypothetical protein